MCMKMREYEHDMNNAVIDLFVTNLFQIIVGIIILPLSFAVAHVAAFERKEETSEFGKIALCVDELDIISKKNEIYYEVSQRLIFKTA